MQKIILAIFVVLVLVSCSASKQEIEQKIEPKLLSKIIDIENSGLDEYVQFTGICKVDLSYEMRDEIEHTGARIDKYSKNVFSAIGTTVNIRRVAQLSFVNFIKSREE